MQLLEFTESGIYCPIGKFYIDPWRGVDCAVITHAHADHAHWGSKHYIAHHHSLPIMRLRLGNDISVQGYEYGDTFTINNIKITLYPAGHIIGSAQVKVEYKGEIWVASGDYKLATDGFTPVFEPVKCHTFITESTFGLPIFQWRPQNQIFAEINEWWRNNSVQGNASLLIGYSLGKAQRLLQNLDESIGPIFTHGAIANVNEALASLGINLKPTMRMTAEVSKDLIRKSLIMAPPSALDSPWMKKFQPYEVGIASGWMALRGTRRRRNADRGFVVSDHADWNELASAIKATGAEKIFVTHGYTAAYVKYLRENGFDAEEVKTKFSGESMDEITEQDQMATENQGT